jgi:hypothetical protein
MSTFNFRNKQPFSDEQISLLNFFENFTWRTEVEEYEYDKNTPYTNINIRQHHFDNGTVRITKPGIYTLQEDIVFEPNSQNDFMPTGNQIMSGRYPVGLNGAYHLGFFAAITVECKDIILNLNNFSVKQSKLHYLQQRFYANIELASAPFIPKQGPGSFSIEDTYKNAENVLIKNGTLGLSSHHGIHGNTMKSVILQNLTLENFEIAGIALNGGKDSFLDNIEIKNTKLDVPISAKYSQSRFIRQFLKKIPATTTFNGKSRDEIINNLNAELLKTQTAVMNGGEGQGIFKHHDFGNGADGNTYGIVLNVNGVAVNDFILNRSTSMIGNQNIFLQDIKIYNIISNPNEWIALSSGPELEEAYGGKRQVGPAGDVLDINKITDADGLYKGNVLSDAQLIIAKAKNTDKNLSVGTVNIEEEVVSWAETKQNLTTMMTDNSYYFVKGGDSMGHSMKGNIGMFLSCGEKIELQNVNIINVVNKGDNVGKSNNSARGGNANGICITGFTDFYFYTVNISGVSTENSNSVAKNIEIL